MIWNRSHENEHCDLCDDTGLAEVRGIDFADGVVYDVGCAPCPDCEMGRRRIQFDLSGIVEEGQEKPPRDWKQRRWPSREPSDFIRTADDHIAQQQLALKQALRLAEERSRQDADNFVGAEPPPP